jgi:hypothetical protein
MATKERTAWNALRARCRTTTSYIKRGITVADEWLGPDGFAAFLDHVGPAPSPAHSLDRIDNNSGYRPGNVRWATCQEQARNTSSYINARTRDPKVGAVRAKHALDTLDDETRAEVLAWAASRWSAT